MNPQRLIILLLLSLPIGFCRTETVEVYENNSVAESLDCKKLDVHFSSINHSTTLCGPLFLAQPLDACSTLINYEFDRLLPNTSAPIALIVEGGCSNEDKVGRAQDAGFQGAIIYDRHGYHSGPFTTEDSSTNSTRICIRAFSVSETASETLNNYAGVANAKACFEESQSSLDDVLLYSSLFTIICCVVIITVGYYCSVPRTLPNGVVKAMASEMFNERGGRGDSTCASCAICFEDYVLGEKIRVLPCRHKFHAFCVDSWLTNRRAVCPVCNRRVNLARQLVIIIFRFRSYG